VSRGDTDLDDYSIQVGNLYGDVSFPVGPVSLSLYGQVWMNFAADAANGVSQSRLIGLGENADGQDMGWSLGLSGTMDQVHFAYSYSVLEADSQWGGYTDAAAGVANSILVTNVQGHKANIGYDITKNWALDFTYYNFENIEEAAALTTDVEDTQAYQFDVSYKF